MTNLYIVALINAKIYTLVSGGIFAIVFVCICIRKPKAKYVIFLFQKEKSPTTACLLMAIAQPISADGPLRSLSPRKDVAAALKEIQVHTRKAF